MIRAITGVTIKPQQLNPCCLSGQIAPTFAAFFPCNMRSTSAIGSEGIHFRRPPVEKNHASGNRRFDNQVAQTQA